MTDYPILVRRLAGNLALTVVCLRCHTEAVIHPDYLLNEGLYTCPADFERGRTASTEPRCGGSAVMKYDEGDECRNCDKLGYWSDRDSGIRGYCSRRCKLQHEYLQQLRGAA